MSNGKGDSSRNCFSKQFKDNFDDIDWSDEEDERRTNEEDVEAWVQQAIDHREKIEIGIDKNWEDDYEARLFLESRGYIIDKDTFITHEEGNRPTEEEINAFVYLVNEWDYAGYVG